MKLEINNKRLPKYRLGDKVELILHDDTWQKHMKYLGEVGVVMEISVCPRVRFGKDVIIVMDDELELVPTER